MIGLEDIDRLFKEMNSNHEPATETAWWLERFTTEGHKFLLDIIPVTLRMLIMDCETTEQVVAVFNSLWVGGIRLGWELKEQYGSEPL